MTFRLTHLKISNTILLDLLRVTFIFKKGFFMKKIIVGFAGILFCQNVFGIGNGIESWDPKTRIICGLLAGTCTLAVGSSIAESDITKQIAPWGNMSASDMAALVGVSATLGAASFFGNDEFKNTLRSWAWQVPVAGLSISLMQSKMFNYILKKVPFLGEYLACKNKNCEGICQDCKCRKGIVQQFVWQVVIQKSLFDLFSSNASDNA